MSFCKVWWKSIPAWVLMGPNMDLQESMSIVSENPVLDEAFVRAHPEFLWDAKGLSRNPSLSERFLQKLGIPKEVKVHEQPRLLEIDWDSIVSTPEIEWDMKMFSRSARVSIHDLWRYPLVWDFAELSQNPSLTWDHVRAFPEKPWDYERLLRNPMSAWKEQWTNRTFWQRLRSLFFYK